MKQIMRMAAKRYNVFHYIQTIVKIFVSANRDEMVRLSIALSIFS